MTTKKKVIVKINGQDYTVIGEESEEYIEEIGKYVDSKVQDLISKNSRLNQTMAAVLTAFTITDEYYKTYMELNELKDSIIEPFKELEKLRKECIENNELIELLSEENDLFKNKNNKISKSELDNIEKISHYEDMIKTKDDELETSQKLINQLQNKLFENQIELVQVKKELDELMKVYDKE